MYLQLWLWIKMPKSKRGKLGTLQNMNVEKLQRLYTQTGAAYGSAHNVVKISNLPVSTVRLILHWKPSFTKSFYATHQFKRMNAFAGFTNELWCMHSAYIDKLTKANNGVKCLLVLQDLIDRTVDARAMKTKDSKKTLVHFWLRLQKKFGSTREQSLPQSLTNYTRLSEDKYTPQWVRLRLHLLKVHYNLWKVYYTVTWEIVDASTFTNRLISLQPWSLETIAR